MFACDLSAAMNTLEQILAQPGLTTAGSRAATRARDLARLVARAQPRPDYSAARSATRRHWRLFILIGDHNLIKRSSPGDVDD